MSLDYDIADFVAVDAEDRLVCDECGSSFVMLSSHLWQAHAISADDYRAARGIPGYVGLTATDLKQTKARNSRNRMNINPEKWADIRAKGLAPDVRAKQGDTFRGRYRAGQYQLNLEPPPEFFDGSGHAALAEKRQDPEFVEAWKKKVRGHRGGWIEQKCEVCGEPYGQYRSENRVTCGAECAQTARTARLREARAAYAAKMATDPEFRRRAEQRFAEMQNDPAVRAKANETRRQNALKRREAGPHDERNYRRGCRCEECKADHARVYRIYRATGSFPELG